MVPTTSLALDQGDVVLLLSDGFFEWSRPHDGEAFGISRLHHALASHAWRDAAEILQTIHQSVQAFCDGSPQSDDMTAIVIKRTAPAVVL